MRLYIGNLPHSTTGEQVVDLFEQIGAVQDIELIVDGETGCCKGFGFVDMADEAAAQALDTLNGYVLDDHVLRIGRARTRHGSASPALLHVANLPVGVTADQLADLLGAAGEVATVQLHATNGQALVRMATDAAAQAALRFGNEAALGGQRLAISPYAPGQPARLDRTLQAQVERLAAGLGETEEAPIAILQRLVQYCGPVFAQMLFEETLAIEADGGLMLPGGTRRRTAGGVFFHLVRRRLSKAMKGPVLHPTALANSSQRLPRFDWRERAALIDRLLAEKGTATTVKIRLIGRPGTLERQRKLVIVTMRSIPAEDLTLPKGVPRPPLTETVYVVYIASRQWASVADALLDDPEDALIVEGVCTYNTQLSSITVFAQDVTTKRLQQAQQAARSGAPAPPTSVTTEGQAVSGQPLPAPTDPPAVKAETAAAPTPPLPAGATSPAEPAGPGPHPLPVQTPGSAAPPGGSSGQPGLAEAARKLAELGQTEQEARQRLEALKALPPAEQVGMGQALQTLQRVKAERTALRRRYPRLA